MLKLEDLKPGYKESITFKIDSGKIEAFSALVQDQSSLHVDESFSRRTKYRSRLAPGMLVFSHLPDFNFFHQDKIFASISKLEIKFILPVFLETEIKMNLEIMSQDLPNNFKIKISAENQKDQKEVLSSMLTVNLAERQDQDNFRERYFLNPKNDDNYPSSSLISNPIEEANLTLEEIEEGRNSIINFCVRKEHLGQLRKIIDLDAPSNSSNPTLTPILIQVLSLSLFSTLVGMGLPGRNATFLSMEADLLGAILLDHDYVLQGEVKRKSLATKTIQLEISLQDQASAKKYLGGKIMAAVNPPAREMAALPEIKEKYFDFNLKDKVVLITGASRGIGETTAKLFSLHGSKVIINYCYGEKEAQKIVGEIKENKGEALAMKADVSQIKEVQEMVRLALEKYGRIDILVNNAVRNFLPQDFLHLDWEEVQKDLEVNLKGAFNCCQAVIPSMLAHQGGSIINVSSLATDNPPPRQLKYVVSKSGLMGLTRSLALDYAKENIRVNMVVPNFVETDLVAGIAAPFRKKIAEDIPLKRLSAPAEVAQSIVFLASSYSSYITGQRIMVTGGSLPLL